MKSNFHIALLQCPQVVDHLDFANTKVYQTNSIKNLIRLVIEKDIDLIIYRENLPSSEKFLKIFKKFYIPSMSVDGKSNVTGLLPKMILDGGSLPVNDFIAKNEWMIRAHRLEREKLCVDSILQKTVEFSKQVIHSGVELFIAETKKYFMSNFNVRNVYWVEVQGSFHKLPPILRLKHQLQNQKINQGALIAELDDCCVEVIHEEEFQMWKTQNGYYVMMVWIPQGEKSGQCLVLSDLRFSRRTEILSFFRNFCPILFRRWSLCLTLEDAQSQIYKDTLTDLYNQKFLNEVVKKKIEEYRRYNTPFSVLFIDVDFFKKVNDSKGHIIGSGVLSQMGALLKEQIRDSDFAFRYGGDEFIIILSHTTGEDAMAVAERVRKNVENFQFHVNNIKVKVTVSIGLAFYPEHAQSAEEIIRIADEAMYYGKSQSRNIVYKAS